ncbi:hypothetical protein [Shewanella pealeana]|uniref:HEPN AbiU2-like domain-containing protein n=1 Tax=Shewanella pealeana (strain ATCC 700345 / ANG-SQ1) TaxID=398579 RepID=A8H0H0_SHEPA|nr:hypothetical protein [Shewanella pealeana]ABV86057.1 hypothetical protein Spea_0730 [Shewanella pealeana ATCC 700345]
MEKKNKLSVDEIVESMLSSVCETSNSERVWRVLIDPVMHLEFKTQFNMYSSFMLTTSRSTFATLLMGLSRISDDQNNSMSIPKLLELAESDSNSVEIEELRHKYSDLNKTWQSLKHIRHNVYAHISANTTEFSAFERAGVTPNDLTEAANVTKEIVLSVYDLLGYDSAPYKNLHVDAKLDLQKLFRNLKAGRDVRLSGA